jgi:hypothetical protein
VFFTYLTSTRKTEIPMKLTDLYDQEMLDDESEFLCHHITEAALSHEFEVREMAHDQIANVTTPLGDMTVIEALETHADKDQRDFIEALANDFDRERIIVLDGMRAIDGNHHLAAAHLSGGQVRYIDLSEVPPEPCEAPEL